MHTFKQITDFANCNFAETWNKNFNENSPTKIYPYQQITEKHSEIITNELGKVFLNTQNRAYLYILDFLENLTTQTDSIFPTIFGVYGRVSAKKDKLDTEDIVFITTALAAKYAYLQNPRTKPTSETLDFSTEIAIWILFMFQNFSATEIVFTDYIAYLKSGNEHLYNRNSTADTKSNSHRVTSNEYFYAVSAPYNIDETTFIVNEFLNCYGLQAKLARQNTPDKPEHLQPIMLKISRI
ncbi:MAG: hypothetical protein LBM93_15240 [Oscillospiraceae bacterium]|jgi:hypothetical protein|nr:hypothetical protein [Oscillospiraceae bacterium]